MLGGLAASLGIFGLLRLNWIEAHVVLPFTRAQGDVAVRLFGPSTLPVEATLACSGADAIALCLGAVLAYPVAWSARLAGAAAGVALIVVLNTVRIGTLGQAVASPTLFSALHLYIWPAALTLAIAGYVAAWMRIAERRHPYAPPSVPTRTLRSRPAITRRFIVLMAVFVIAFLAVSPTVLASAAVFGLGGFMAGMAAAMLGVAGVTAHAADNVLWTTRGGFLVTQECIATPLIPIYLAAICSVATTWPRIAVGVLAALPLFTALGIARLLLVAVPDTMIASPVLLAHAFFQVLLAIVIVCLAAVWRHRGGAAPRRVIAGVIAGVLFVALLGPLYGRIVGGSVGAGLADPQGAIALLPPFQIGLYLALWIAAFESVAWRRILSGLALLALTQVAGLIALQALESGMGLTAHVRDIRGWAIAGPVLALAVVVKIGRARR